MAESVLDILIKARSDAGKVLEGLGKQARTAKASLEEINQMDTAILQAAVDEAAKSLEGLGLSAENVNKRLREMGFDTAQREADQFIKKLETLKEQFDELVGIGARLAASGAGPVLFGKAIVQDAADFSKQIASISVVSGGAIGNLEKITDQVQKLSVGVGENKEVVADALFKAISNGAKDAADATALLTAADALGDATGVKFAQTNESLVEVIKAFGLEMGRAGEVADSLFVAVQNGGGPLESLTSLLRVAGPTAKALGIDFQDLVTVTQALGKSGVQGRQGIQALRGLLNSLAKPSEQLQRFFLSIGEGSVEASVKTRGLAGALKLLLQATGGNVKELEVLIGGQQEANALAALGANNFAALTEAMEKQAQASGAAAKAGEEAGKSLGERLDKPVQEIRNAFVSLGNALGEFVLPLLELIGKAAAAFSKWAAENQRLAGALTGIVVVGGALLVVLGTLLGLIGAVGGAITNGLILINKWGGAISILTRLLGPFAVAMRALLLVFTALARNPLVLSITVLLTLVSMLVSRFNEWREASAQLEAQQAKLQERMETLEQLGARDVAIKSTEELIALTDEEINKYQELILQKLKLIAAEKALAATRGDTTAVQRAEAEEEKLLKAIEDSAKVEEERAKAAQDLILSNREIGRSYIRTAEDVQKFIDALNQANKVGTDEMLDSVDLLNKKLVASAELIKTVDLTQIARGISGGLELVPTSTTFRRNNDLLIQAEKQLSAEKLRITQEGSRRSLQIAQIEFNQKKALISRSEIAESEKEEKILSLAREFAQKRVTIVQQEVQSTIQQRDAAFQKYQQSKQKELQLDKQIRDVRIQQEQSLRELSRQGLEDSERRKDIELELEQLKSATRQALEKKDFELAQSLAQRRISLLQSNATQLGGFFGEQVSQQESVKKAVEETAVAQQDVLAAMGGQKDEAKATADAQFAIFQSLEATVRTLQETLSNEATRQLNIEAKIDSTGAKQAIAELVQPTESMHTVRPITAAVDEAIARIQQPTFSTHTVNVVRGGQAPEFASGGHVRGPGTATSDSIMALLSNGEYVIKAAAVKFFGRGLFDSLNSMRMPKRALAGFASGGPVFRKSDFVPRTAGIPAFANGGLVGGSDLGTLNFVFGPGREVQVRTSGDGAKVISEEFTKLARHGVGVRRL